VRPDLAFLCSPNNPTGRIESRSFIERAVAAVPGLLIVDEAYGQFAPWSAMELLGDDVPLVVVRTFSKTWSMAGIRLGYLLGPPAVIEALDKVVLPYHLDSIKQTAGVLALEYDAEMRERVTMLVNERERVVAGLAKLAVTTWPSGANFILFRPATADGNAVWLGLVDHGVLVRNCSSWPRLDGCLRVTIGTPAENDAFLHALSEVLP
jgi:histidinol-phosphate aminotransferase